MPKKLNPTPPGEILLEEFLIPMKITPYRLAKDIGVPQTRIAKIIKNERAITSDTALRLGQYFNMSPEFWMNLQAGYSLKCAKQNWGEKIREEVRPYNKAA